MTAVHQPARTPGVILAAGAGSRLGGLGRRHSKGMVPVAGRPMIDWGIERLQAGGVDELIVVRHVDDAALEAHLRARWPAAAIAVQRQRLGTADALSQALPLLADAPAYLVCACDSLFAAADLAALVAAGARRRRRGRRARSGARRDRRPQRGAVLDGERVVDIVEKPAPAPRRRAWWRRRSTGCRARSIATRPRRPPRAASATSASPSPPTPAPAAWCARCACANGWRSPPRPTSTPSRPAPGGA
ncbi:MAG: sugar phosphate nucleotidyltransferase [Candidatus Binatia bacterium]